MNAALDVIAAGMVTAVGMDSASASAAMRARLDGFQETRFQGSPEGKLTGAPIDLPRKWIGDKRLAHLAAGAICEVFDAVPEARGRTVFILCLAEGDRPGRPVRDNAGLLRMIGQMVEAEPAQRSRVVTHGRPSGHVALDQARRLIAAGEAPFVMIAGVDSYLTSRTISHYVEQRRLLTADNPNGFIPGEAAAAILCARPQRSGFGLYGLGLAREPASIYNKEDLPLRADGMTAAYDTAFGETGIEMNRLGYRISDLIGESHWFKQTALASIRLLRGRHEFQDLWSPAESLGNIGAAAVPLMIGWAWTAASKRYAAGNPVLIEASSDEGVCGAAIFGARRTA
jgi:3-oxoacyl-[acyl-carrier-protein] synthase-1